MSVPVNHRQQGAALLVSLLLLMLLTIMAVSAVNMTSLSLRSTSNQQDQQLAESAVQQALDEKLSESPPVWIRDQLAQEVELPSYVVNIDRPVCLGAVTASGYEERYDPSGLEINRFDNAWRLEARVRGDQSVAGESVEVSQGVVLKAELTACYN